MIKFLPIQEMQIKTLSFHFTSVRMAITKKTSINQCWRGYGGKREPYILLVRMKISTATMEVNTQFP
jgi:hypothetical protein